MGNEDLVRDETARDIVAARAEISGRRDQITAEYGERLAALEQLAAQLAAGELDPKSAQAQVRRILSGERGVAVQRKAGRTKIGMTVPTARPTQAPSQGAAQRSGPSPTRAHLAVSKMIAQIDQRIIHVLRVAKDPESREEARFELSLLLQLRRSLEGYIGEMPGDVILLTSVVEFAEHVEEALNDLEAGGAERLRRLLDHSRTMASELMALGGPVAPIKDQISKARALLASPEANLRQITKQALGAFAGLQQELERRFPQQSPSLLDELVRA